MRIKSVCIAGSLDKHYRPTEIKEKKKDTRRCLHSKSMVGRLHGDINIKAIKKMKIVFRTT